MTGKVLAAAMVWVVAASAYAADINPENPFETEMAPFSAPDNSVHVSPVTDEMLASPSDADWLSFRRTLDSWGYSPLKQINERNVGRLRLVWTRGLNPGVQEGTPLVHDGILFFPSPNDITQAFDAATGALKWEHRRKLPSDLNKYIPIVVTNRNLAIYRNLIIDLGADSFVYALNTVDGKLVWETKILDYRKGGMPSSGVLIADGKIISGRGCEPASGPDACVIVAHDPATGQDLWRTRTMPRPGEPNDDSWGGVPDAQRWHVGTWMPPSYDPELKLMFIGTSVTSPAPKFMLGGNDKKHLYHNSTLAIDVQTGKIVWYYQHLVDHWDLDHVFERMLLDTEVAPDAREVSWINPKVRPGERRKVLTGIPGKTGIVYTLDRQTGELLWARPTLRQNVVSRIDGATGEVIQNPDTLFTAAGQERQVCPSAVGGRNWPAGAYSPLTNTMYFPMQNTCATYRSLMDKPSLESLYGVSSRIQITPGTSNVGVIDAISATTGTRKWKYEQRAGTLSLVATGGGLLFGGDVSGKFMAFSQNDGKVLWEVNLGSPVSGYPISYAVNGRQYIAVSTGPSVTGGGVAALTPEIRSANANNLFVFALPE